MSGQKEKPPTEGVIHFEIKGLKPLRKYQDSTKERTVRNERLQVEIIRLFQELNLPPSSMTSILRDTERHIWVNRAELEYIYFEKNPPFTET